MNLMQMFGRKRQAMNLTGNPKRGYWADVLMTRAELEIKLFSYGRFDPTLSSEEGRNEVSVEQRGNK
jgi:hypothetical protein